MKTAIYTILILVGVLIALPTAAYSQIRTFDFGYGTVTRGPNVTIIRRDPVRMYPYPYSGYGGYGGWQGYNQPQVLVQPRARVRGPYQLTHRKRGPLGKIFKTIIGKPLEFVGDAVGGTLDGIGQGFEAFGGIEESYGPVVDLETGERWCNEDDVECRGMRGEERGTYEHEVETAEAAEEDGYQRARRSGVVQFRRPPDTFE
ncbi:MAG: hypothetical protein O2794_02255 [bacterium]|nr:hypothetical protein [bacterium]